MNVLSKMTGCAALAVALAGGALAGCGPLVPYSDQVQVPPQVTLDDVWLQGKIRVTVLQPYRIPGGQLEVPIRVRNWTIENLSLDYSANFLDANGADTGIPVPAAHLRVGPNDEAQFKITSTSADARDFRVHIRRAQ